MTQTATQVFYSESFGPPEVPPAGFEPAISALKGRHPGPLDDGGREGF